MYRYTGPVWTSPFSWGLSQDALTSMFGTKEIVITFGPHGSVDDADIVAIDGANRSYPVLQLQSVKALLPAGELEPVGQSEHCALPVMSLYVPSTHAVQSLPLLSVYPALHLQSWIEPPGR